MIGALSQNTVNAAYLVSAILLVVAIKSLSSPKRARTGNFLGAAGLAIAVVFTLTLEQVDRYWFVLSAMAVGAAIGAFVRGRIHYPFEDEADAAAALRRSGFDGFRIHRGSEGGSARGAERVHVIEAWTA